jgi:DnaK suppressor protein
MDSEKLEYFRKLLTERLEVLLGESGGMVNGMREGEDRSGDLADEATVESDQSLLLRVHERERYLVVKIHEALDRIENGTYGLCEECGEKISEKRLMARPVTTLCMGCKSSQERQEKGRKKPRIPPGTIY